jgi:thioredoxin-related protein
MPMRSPYHARLLRTRGGRALSAVPLAIMLGLSTAAVAADITALARAADSSALAAALNTGADPEQRDADGQLPLLAAAGAGRRDAVELLLAAGADPDRTNRFGEGALHVAAKSDTAILAILLAAGADPNARDAGGVTPLMLAARAGRADNTGTLRRAGARIDMKDYQGSSIRDWALRGGHQTLAERLGAALDELDAPSPASGSGIDFAEDVFVDVRFPDWFKTSFLDLGEDLDEALQAGKQGILLFISASRCSYCKAFMNTSLAAPDIRRRLQAGFDVIGLEIFDDRELTTVDNRTYRVKEFVLQARASNTPTLIFIGDGGRMLLRIVGYYPPERFRRVLDYLEAHAYRDQTLAEYLRAAQRTGGGAAGPIIEDPLFAPPPYMLDRSRMAAGQPLLVVFEEANCEACERFHRRVLGDKAVRRLMGEFDAVQLDASDGERGLITPAGERTTPAGWYRQLGLNYQPAVLFFDANGREIMRIDSETQRFRMEGSLQMVLDGAAAETAQLQRWRRGKAISRFQREQRD